MNYIVIDLGTWNRYEPEARPSNAPENAMFSRRDGDGVDWYAFARDPRSWLAGSVKATCKQIGDDLVVQAVYRDPSFLFPQGDRLIEIMGVTDDEELPHKLFEQKAVDLDAQTFSDIPAPVEPVITYKKDIWVRATDEEADTIEQVLSQQTVRKQNIFREATYLDHADPLFAELNAAFVTAFGKKRAGQLLAAS